MSMLYRPFGRTGQRVSILGFGCMRLPVIDGHNDKIDVPLATRMLRYAIDRGVNYIDTAYPYHSAAFDGTPGASEGFVGETLTGGYRDKVMVATKLPVWRVKSRQDMEDILAGQLQRLRSERIDCYLLHGLDAAQFERVAGLGALEFLDDAKASGKIRFAGFSFHDEGPSFAPIVDAYDWDFCQIQYNYMDVDYQAGAAGLAYAADRGLAVVVMEPLKGGRLASPVPVPIQTLWDAAPVKRSPVGWALRFIWDDPRVSLLLSGMSTMEQVVENVELASEGYPGSLGAAESAAIEAAQKAYRERIVVDCTGCGYCLPCPQGINIPRFFSLLNNVSLFENVAEEQKGYGMDLGTGHSAAASACTECGQCAEACPQQLDVPREMAGVARTFE
jgi:predicted aldo/keto reductase-like oxidoreductase